MTVDIIFDEGHNFERIECGSISSTSEYITFYDDNNCLIAEYNKSKIVGWNKVEVENDKRGSCKNSTRTDYRL